MSEGVRLYAGTQHGLITWRSTNRGWQEVARHFEDGIIDSIHGCKQSPERVFVGVTHDGLYRTIDGGKSGRKYSTAIFARSASIPLMTKSCITASNPSGYFAAKMAVIAGKRSRR